MVLVERERLGDELRRELPQHTPPCTNAHTEPDGDVDSNDPWYYTAFDERWRALATFRAGDTDPKEEFVPHQAGLDGMGGSSYIDLVICRDKDANTAWTSASDGTLEERGFYAQNWRADVVALVGSDSMQWEQDRYSAYGVPFGLPGGDCDSDGDCDQTDVDQVQTWIDAPAYDVRGDVDLDGDVDAADKSSVETILLGTSSGRGDLGVNRNDRGYSGYRALLHSEAMRWSCRNRTLDAQYGRWLSRDRLGYVDAYSLYLYATSRPIAYLDSDGSQSLLPGSGGGYAASTGAAPGAASDPGIVYSAGDDGLSSDPLGGWISYDYFDGHNSPKECCEFAKKEKWYEKSEFGDALGMSICCDGNVVGCSFYDPAKHSAQPPSPGANPTKKALDKATELVNDCVLQHEAEHFKEFSCAFFDPSNRYSTIYPPRAAGGQVEEAKKNEYKLSQETLSCLIGKIGQCLVPSNGPGGAQSWENGEGVACADAVFGAIEYADNKVGAIQRKWGFK